MKEKVTGDAFIKVINLQRIIKKQQSHKQNSKLSELYDTYIRGKLLPE